MVTHWKIFGAVRDESLIDYEKWGVTHIKKKTDIKDYNPTPYTAHTENLKYSFQQIGGGQSKMKS